MGDTLRPWSRGTPSAAPRSARLGRLPGRRRPWPRGGPTAALLLSLLVVACGGVDPTPTTTVEPLPIGPTAADADATTSDGDVGAERPSPTAPVSAPTTGDPGEPDATPTPPPPPAAPPVVEEASGSGCTPGRTDGLPDGRWFGIVEEVGSDEVVFDLACWFTGDAATRAAAEDGEESPPPNDYHVRNDNDLLRTIAVEPTAEVVWLVNPADPSSALTTTYDVWRIDEAGRSFRPPAWLTVEDDRVVAMEEQYVP